MGQFDSPSEAALARLKSDTTSSSSVGSAVSSVASIGGKILEALGFVGASVPIDLMDVLRKLAVGKDEGNLLYFGEALVDDIRRLYQQHAELKQQFDELLNSKEFNEVVANATLYITRTNVEGRLKRLAHIITNGVQENDLEPESLDDMMRAAVELRNLDVAVLKFISSDQKQLLEGNESPIEGWPQPWIASVQVSWEKSLVERGKIFPSGKCSRGQWRSSLARLQALGFITPVESNPTSTSGEEPYALLPSGQTFLERLSVVVPES